MSSVSLHVGVSRYGYEAAPLNSPVIDAAAMYRIARSGRYTWLGQPLPEWDGSSTVVPPNVLLNEQATLGRVTAALLAACQTVGGGERLFVTFSGHGAWLDDGRGLIDEDQALCLYDRLMRDDTIYCCLARLPAGARVYFLADSCHSESVCSMTPEEATKWGRPKSLGQGTANAKWGSEKRTYRQAAGMDCEEGNRPEVQAFVAQFSACRRDQSAYDGPTPHSNSLFTSKFLEVWNDGTFGGSCQELVDAVTALSYTDVVPTLTPLGPNGAARAAFLDATPIK